MNIYQKIYIRIYINQAFYTTKFVVTEFGAFSTAEYRNEQSGRLCQPFAQFNGAQFIGI